jgi:hypothetical protein
MKFVIPVRAVQKITAGTHFAYTISIHNAEGTQTATTLSYDY